jgi:hypothetical protein
MAAASDERQGDDDWLEGSPAHQLATRLGLAHPTRPRRGLRVALLVLATWAPLVIFSLAAGTALGDRVNVPLLRDPEIYIRFLFVVPLLELARFVVLRSITVQIRHLAESGFVTQSQLPLFESARIELTRLRRSATAEATLLAVAFLVPMAMRVFAGFDVRPSSWERIEGVVTLAGWWYVLVSLPLLFFLLLRWCWVFVIWARFLFQVSRLDLELTATHPDRAGGLGFIGWGIAAFATVAMAISAIISGGLAHEIAHRGRSLDELKYHLIVFGVVAILILHAPLFVFAGRLGRCRFTGMLEFGALVWRHDRAFDEKWIKSPESGSRSPLGSSDVGSLADIAAAYEHVSRMRLIPLDEKALVVSLVAVLAPMVPLMAAQIPVVEILSKLGEFIL